MKTCTKCKQTKPLEMFETVYGGSECRRADCKDCRRALAQQRANLRKRIEEPSEDHVCPVCTRSHDEVDTWCLDHCHTTGAFRGWICNNCNVAIGNFKDNIQSMERAIEYLKAPSSDKQMQLW